MNTRGGKAEGGDRPSNKGWGLVQSCCPTELPSLEPKETLKNTDSPGSEREGTDPNPGAGLQVVRGC